MKTDYARAWGDAGPEDLCGACGVMSAFHGTNGRTKHWFVAQKRPERAPAIAVDRSRSTTQDVAVEALTPRTPVEADAPAEATAVICDCGLPMQAFRPTVPRGWHCTNVDCTRRYLMHDPELRHSVAAIHPAPEEATPRDSIARRTDIGLGYWDARAMLAKFTTQRIAHSDNATLAAEGANPFRWRHALECCADAFAAFVLHKHEPLAARVFQLEATVAELTEERDALFRAAARVDETWGWTGKGTQEAFYAALMALARTLAALRASERPEADALDRSRSTPNASAVSTYTAEHTARLAAEQETERLRFMVRTVHQMCDKAGIPKPPENEPGIPWRVLWLLRERRTPTPETGAP